MNVLIVDDSLYSRSRSKSVELLARVRDHVEHKYVKGFRLLTLGWSDGNTFLHLAFTLLSSEKKENRLCPENQNIDKRTNGSKLRKEAILKSPEVMLRLLEQASKYAVPASYILFDSWFTYPKTLIQILELKLNTIAMVSYTSIVFTRYIMLTLESHKNNDVRTIGGFFYQCCDELQDIQFCEVMNFIIDILKDVLTEKLLLSKDVIDSIIDSFIAALPCYIKEKLVFLSCES